MKLEEPHKEFLLSILRVASARLKLMDNEILTIGCALKGDLVCSEMAVKMLHDAGLMWLVEPLPGKIGAVALSGVNENGVAG